MIIHLISVGNRMPKWVEQGYNEYAKRLPPECSLKLVEIPPGHRGKGADIARAVRDEGDRILKAIPRDCHVIALEVKGREWSTEQLADKLDNWMGSGRDLVLLVGGPDGLSDNCRSRADQQWSLSSLTMPHPLVRVILAEQIYRAWSLMRNHPYHRA